VLRADAEPLALRLPHQVDVAADAIAVLLRALRALRAVVGDDIAARNGETPLLYAPAALSTPAANRSGPSLDALSWYFCSVPLWLTPFV
jgi:hypothetical protein